jgi:hypothetical protein
LDLFNKALFGQNDKSSQAEMVVGIKGDFAKETSAYWHLCCCGNGGYLIMVVLRHISIATR